MNPGAPAGIAVVVARDERRAARVEAVLRRLAGWRICLCTPPTLRTLVDEHPSAIVVVVAADPETRRLLRGVRGWPRPPAIIGLSADATDLWTPMSRAAGLRAALPLDATAEELTAAVRAVQAGLLVVHPGALAPRVRPARADAVARAPLTPREREILELMADGASNRIIASRLGISRHTAKFHVASILAKFGVDSRTRAVAQALRSGLLAV
ncbi:MAG TPA: response regulator transcription factor [Methylomirabilota bacterium]|nr:response regulator transcription factor [Methylomirabilota bacterium]